LELVERAVHRTDPAGHEMDWFVGPRAKSVVPLTT
jgi:hypothetical protein